jgi:hypothetical protein
MHTKHTFRAAAVAATMAMSATAYGQILFIYSATDIFVPSFRDLTNTDAGNTTYYGWGPGTFDGGVNNELMESPAPALGLGGLNGTLNQLGTADILSGTNNLFIGTNGVTETLTMQIPTNGVPGVDGFTTIILQGLTNGTGAGLINNLPVFDPINGISPTFAVALNSLDVGQWWVKYEIPGNAATYNLTATVSNFFGSMSQSNPLSIKTITVDTVYSPTGYATETAVPEPASIGLLAIGGFAMLRRRRR